ncbi:LPD38 domain-containing protein [Aeromonas dhakensis]|uniref:LPD38 domain-containing protein n=1 Tax=Aeromonas dhakensis TaxID=196024 RepID=UPI001FFDA1D6|nr:LPD38 domain-containing protein [Aeromonas dhakensis]
MDKPGLRDALPKPQSSDTRTDPFWSNLDSSLSAATAPIQASQSISKRDLDVGLGDVARGVGAGALDLVGGIGELARQASNFGKENAGKQGGDYLEQARAKMASKLSPVLDMVAGAGDLATSGAESLTEGMSADAKEAMGRRLVDETPEGRLTLGDGAGDIDVWAMKMAQGIGSILPTLMAGGVTGVAAKASIGRAVTASMVKRGATQEVAEAVAAKAVSKIATGAAVTTGATGSVGSAGVNTRDTVLGMSFDELAASDTFRQSFTRIDQDQQTQHLSDEEKLGLAREETANLASRATMSDAKVWGAAAMGSMMGDAMLFKMLAGKAATGGVLKGAAKGAAGEGISETLEEGVQQYAVNESLNQVAAADIDPMKGVVSSALEGGLIGMGTGGALGGVGGMRSGKSQVESEGGAQVDSASAEEAAPIEQGEPVPADTVSAQKASGLAPAVDTVAEPVMPAGEQNPLGPSTSQFDELRDTPAYLRLDGTAERYKGMAADSEVQRALAGELGQSVQEMVASQVQAGDQGKSLYERAQAGELGADPFAGNKSAQQVAMENQRPALPLKDVIFAGDANSKPKGEAVAAPGDHDDHQVGTGPQFRGGERTRWQSGQEGDLLPPEAASTNLASELPGAVIEGEAREVGTELPHRDVFYGADQRQSDAKPLRGSAPESAVGPLQTLRITRKGKPFATEKEAAMASRKGKEMPVPLNDGGFGVAEIAEVEQAQAATATQPNSPPFDVSGIADSNQPFDQPAASVSAETVPAKSAPAGDIRQLAPAIDTGYREVIPANQQQAEVNNEPVTPVPAIGSERQGDQLGTGEPVTAGAEPAITGLTEGAGAGDRADIPAPAFVPDGQQQNDQTLTAPATDAGVAVSEASQPEPVASEPDSAPTPWTDAIDNPDGTITLKGEEPLLKQWAKDNGVKAILGKGGLLVAKSSAPKVREYVAPAASEPLTKQWAHASPDELHSGMDRLFRGEMSYEEFRDFSDRTITSGDAIKVMFGGWTVPKLKEYLTANNAYVFSGTKKAELVERASRIMQGEIRWPSAGGASVLTTTSNPFSKSNARPEETLRAEVQGITEARYGEFVARRKELIAAHEARKEAIAKAVANPQTLDDYRLLARMKGRDGMTAEQVGEYERLLTEAQLDKQDADKAAKQAAKLTATPSGDIIKTTHTKHGYDLFVVQMANRVEKDEYTRINAKAKEMGGWYSSFKGVGAVPGFQFKDEAHATDFRAWLTGQGQTENAPSVTATESTVNMEVPASSHGDKVAKQIAGLRQRADTIRTKANAALAVDRNTNTLRRAGMAARANAAAEEELRTADLLDAIADGVSTGKANILRNLTTKAQLVTLSSRLGRAMYDLPPAEYERLKGEGLIRMGSQGRHEWTEKAGPLVRVEGAKMPGLDYWTRQLNDLASEMQASGNRSHKAAGVKLKSLVKAAEANQLRQVAVTDRDLIDKLTAFVRGSQEGTQAFRVAEQLADADRLNKMGIFSRANLRAALVELQALEAGLGKRAEVSPLRAKEQALKLKLLGNRNAFIDFFPTTEDDAADLAGRLGIEPGMTVLEPSAGHGMLADAARAAGAKVDAVEIASDLRDILTEKGYTLAGNDFMAMTPSASYDAVIMNPPFSNGMDMDHVRHAYDFLKPGGKLAAIVSAGAGQQSTRKGKEFAKWLDTLGAEVELMREGAFKDSLNPTSVRTKIIVIKKPASEIKPPPSGEGKRVSEGRVDLDGVVIRIPTIDEELQRLYNQATHRGQGVNFASGISAGVGRILNDMKASGLLETAEQKTAAEAEVQAWANEEAVNARKLMRDGIKNPSWAITGRSGRKAQSSAAQDAENRRQAQHNKDQDARIKALRDELKKLRPKEVIGRESFNYAWGKAKGMIADYASAMSGGQPNLLASLRKSMNAELARYLQSMGKIDTPNFIKTLKEQDQRLKDAGHDGLVAIVGARSNPGKIITDAIEGRIRFSKQAMSQGARPVKHLTRKEAGLVTKGWFKQYRGASGIDVQIHATQVELEESLGLDAKEGLIRRAAFDDDAATLHVAADTITDPKRMREILRHEVLAHYGLANVLGDGEYTKLMSRLIQSQKDPSMKPVWDWVNTHYADEDIGTKAEEVVAHLAELEQGVWGRGWDRVVAWVTRALRAVGFVPDGITAAETRSLIEGLGRKLQRNDPDDNGPDGGKKFSQEDAQAPAKKGGVKMSQASTAADTAMGKLNLGPKPDIIDKTKTNLNKLRQVDRGVVTSWIDRVIKKANTEVLDALAPIKYAEEAAGITEAADSGYVAARMATGAASTMQATMLYGLPEWKDGVIQRKAGTGDKDALLGIFSDLGADLHNWLGWMAGHRAELLMEQGRENLLSGQDIAALKGLGKGKEAKFMEAKARWNRLNASTLDLAQEAGLFTKEARDEFESEWYIPFFRESDDGDVIAPFKPKGIANQNAGIKKLKGGEANTNDLLENIFTSTSKLIDASMKNMAAQKIVWNLADTGLIEVVAKPNMMDWRALKNGKDLITVKLEGEDYMIRVEDPDLYRAMTFFDRQPFGSMVNMASKAKRLLTAGVTASPEFMLRNFLRDSLSSWAISKDGFKPVIDSIKGVKKTLAMDGSTIDVMFSGASFLGGYVNGNDPTAMADTVRKSLRRKGMTPEQIARYEKSIIRNAAQAKGVVANVWEKYNRYGEALENANREAVYDAAIKAGKSYAQAAFESKDLMDFSMLGAARAIQGAAMILPFFNARLQGLGKLTRELRDNPREIAKRAGMITAMSLGLLAANWDDERYEELPDWDKDANWHFFVGDQHFRIPKPFEIGVMFGTIPERMMRAMGDKDSGAQFGKAVARAIGDTFALNPTPQIVKPMVEAAFNYDSFRGGPIDSPQDLAVKAEARYNEQTSLLMRELGELSGFSPKQLEHLVIGYTGTMGSYVMAAADGLIRAARPGESASWRADEIPLVKAVYRGTGPAKSTQHMEEFYRMLNEVNQLKRTVDQYRNEGLTDKADELLDEQGGILKSRRSLSRTQQQVRVVRNKIELIQRDRTMSAEEKRRRIDELLARRNDLVYQAVNKNKGNWE